MLVSRTASLTVNNQAADKSEPPPLCSGDQGTSGCLSQINLKTGSVRKVAVGLDYAQFPSVEASTGRVFVPLALHSKVVVYDPRPSSAFSPVIDTALAARNISASINGGWSAVKDSPVVLTVTIDEMVGETNIVRGGVTLASTRSATAAASPVVFYLMQSRRCVLFSDPAANPTVTMWLRIPAEQLELYKLELPYNDADHAGPDTFALPNVECTLTLSKLITGQVRPGALFMTQCRCSYCSEAEVLLCLQPKTGGICKVSVQPNHRHHGPRWPMLVYNHTGAPFQGRSFPQEGWDASPESYLIFVHAHFYD